MIALKTTKFFFLEQINSIIKLHIFYKTLIIKKKKKNHLIFTIIKSRAI